MLKFFLISLLLSSIYARPIIRDPVVNTTDAPLITTTTDEPSIVGELSVNDEQKEMPPPPFIKKIGNTKSTSYYAYDPWNIDEDACGTVPVAIMTTFNNPEPCEFTISPCIKLPSTQEGTKFVQLDFPTAVRVVCANDESQRVMVTSFLLV